MEKATVYHITYPKGEVLYFDNRYVVEESNWLQIDNCVEHAAYRKSEYH